MSKAGRERAMLKAQLPEDGGMFLDMDGITQKERFACQAFCKMLERNPKKVDDGFVNWVDWKASQECGVLYKTVHNRVQVRLAKNAKLRASEAANEGLKND